MVRHALTCSLCATSFVETKGRTLEEINEIFEAESPVKKSLQQHIVEETDLGLLYHGMLNNLHEVEEIALTNGESHLRNQRSDLPANPAQLDSRVEPGTSHQSLKPS